MPIPKSFCILKSAGSLLGLSAILVGCGGGAPVQSSSQQAPTTSSVASSAPSSTPPVSSAPSSVASSSSSSAPAQINLPLVVAVNAGGSALSMDGDDYIADKYYRGGSLSDTSDNIADAGNSALFQTERYGAYSYEVPVIGSGRFSVKLHFAEIYQDTADARSFSVAIEGNTVVSNLDLFAQYGHDVAHTVVLNNLQVNDESVSIELIAGTENPTISGFAIYSNDFELDTTEPEIPVFTGEKFIGNITTGGQIRSDFLQYWNQITPENEGKWGSVERNRDQYNWGPVDNIYQFTRQNGIPMKAHTLVWGSQQPGWIDSLSPSEQAAEIEEWIRDYCNRYPETEMIDVVNEAIDSHAPANYAKSAFGNDWITKSFQLARQYCPNSILIYNDYNFMTWDTDTIINLIRPAVESGYVDALGMQAHSLYDPKVWTAQEIKDKLDQISQLGLPIYISEYDIEATNDQTQLEYMQMHFPVFWDHPNVVGITLWGYIYGSTWRTGTGLIRNGQPRPALNWLMENYIIPNR